MTKATAMGVKARYQQIAPQLQKTLALKNVMEIPRLVKVTLNCGAGKAAQDKKLAQQVQEAVTAIAGQHAVITKARKSESGFSIREGWPVGCSVTLRGETMYRFLDRLLVVALPRVKDFRGLNPRSFDGRGNFSFGLKEQTVFPEIDFDKVDQLQTLGLDISVVTTAKNNEQALALLKALGFPFRD